MFQPSWLASSKLIRPQESESAKIQMITPTLTKFELEWLTLQVQNNALIGITLQESYAEAVRDLFIGILELLNQTPIQAFGINLDLHYGIQSRDSWHQVGHQLVPKAFWEEFLIEPGTRSLTIQGKRPDSRSGFIAVKVEPSTELGEGQNGLYVQVNDHYEFGPEDLANDQGDRTLLVREIIAAEWSASIDRSEKIATAVIRLAG